MEIKQGFKFKDMMGRHWKVVSYNDTDCLWLCQDLHGNIQYFSTEKIKKCFDKWG